MTREHARAVFVIADPLFFSERRRISDLAIKHQLPSFHGVSNTRRPEDSFLTGRATPISSGEPPSMWTRS